MNSEKKKVGGFVRILLINTIKSPRKFLRHCTLKWKWALTVFLGLILFQKIPKLLKTSIFEFLVFFMF